MYVPNRFSAALDDRIYERCEDLPRTPATGNYVVVDVLSFSSTVVELLAEGASAVRVPHNGTAVPDEVTLTGGEPTGLVPGPNHDFHNSPTEPHRLDVDGETVSLTSNNGARAVNRLRSRLDDASDLYVASTTNAAATAAALRSDAAPTYLVCAGSEGTRRLEDVVGALLLGQRLDGIDPTPVERDGYRALLEIAPEHPHSEQRRRELSVVTAFDSRSVVAKLVGGALVDVSDVGEGRPTGSVAADGSGVATSRDGGGTGHSMLTRVDPDRPSDEVAGPQSFD